MNGRRCVVYNVIEYWIIIKVKVSTDRCYVPLKANTTKICFNLVIKP